MSEMDVRVLFVACVLPVMVLGFQDGAGAQACLNLIPVHDGTTANTTQAPYSITVNATSIKQGTTVTVTLNATAADGYFKGFLVQARCTKCTTADTAIVPGTFAKYTASDDTIQTKNCAGVDQNSITHTSAVEKTSAMFTWTAPSDFDVSQGIEFRAAVVQTRPIWWNTVMSDEISVTAAPSSSSQSALGMAVVLVSITASLLL
ncbi:putative defense protein 3 isoform X2 [Haliotis rubra]|uniref:putative defense protein 3 isoform X2 n=1 Tax=Haliotis rubra TaxID=36100 RepID=UPI001EE6028B|nr:putative defense protein 3 isoform X2 [Haliotis rubra]